MTARDPLRLLFAALAVETLLVIVSWLAPASETIFMLQRWIWFALGAAEVVAIAWMQRIRRGGPSEQLWMAALIAAGIDAALGLWSPGGLWLSGLAPMLVGVIAWVLLWLALARDAGPDRGAKWTPLFVGLALARLALSATRMWMSMHRLGPSAEIGETLRTLGWLSLTASLAARVVLLIPIVRLMSDEEGPVAPQQRH